MALSANNKVALSRIKKHHSTQGFSIVEVCVVMAIMVLIGMAVASVSRIGVEAQYSQREQATLQTIAQNIVDDIRYDLRMAETVTISANSLNIVGLDNDNNAVNITYTLSGGNLSRNDGASKVYNQRNVGSGTQEYTPAVDIVCPAPCFQEVIQGVSDTMLIDSMAVTAVQGSSVLDTTFDQGTSFVLEDVSFDLMSQTEFQ